MQGRSTPTRREGLVLLALVAAVAGLSGTWRAVSQAQWGRDAARLARPGDIRMLSSQTCIYCTRARAWFKAHDVPFEECFIEQDTACRAEFEALGAPGTPVLRVRGRMHLGFDPSTLVASLSGAPRDGPR